jgi:aspartate racemase
MHLGLIGGIGPAATEFYYRSLVRAHASANRAMELTIVHADLRELLQNMADNAPHTQAQVFLRLAQRLQGAGADVVAVTSIAGHFCIREFETLSPLPIINAIPELQAELEYRKLRRVGLLGTRAVMASHLYGSISAIEVVVPEGDSFDATHNEYLAMATAGRASERQREFFFAVGNDLCRRQGAESVVLAGTDLFLAFEGYECGFPVIDSAQIHVNALYRASINGSSKDAG